MNLLVTHHNIVASLVPKGYSAWLNIAHDTYGIPFSTLQERFEQFPLIAKAFLGEIMLDMTDGNCYFDTELYAKESIYAKFKIKVKNSLYNRGVFGVSGVGFRVIVTGSNIIRIDIANSEFVVDTPSNGFEYTFYMSHKVNKVERSDGRVFEKSLNESTINTTYTMTYGKANGWNTNYPAYYGILEIGTETNGLEHLFVPCNNNTMVDIISGNTITNMGSGTARIITLET